MSMYQRQSTRIQRRSHAHLTATWVSINLTATLPRRPAVPPFAIVKHMRGLKVTRTQVCTHASSFHSPINLPITGTPEDSRHELDKTHSSVQKSGRPTPSRQTSDRPKSTPSAVSSRKAGSATGATSQSTKTKTRKPEDKSTNNQASSHPKPKSSKDEVGRPRPPTKKTAQNLKNKTGSSKAQTKTKTSHKRQSEVRRDALMAYVPTCIWSLQVAQWGDSDNKSDHDADADMHHAAKLRLDEGTIRETPSRRQPVGTVLG